MKKKKPQPDQKNKVSSLLLQEDKPKAFQIPNREAEIEVLEKYGSQVDIFYMVNRSADAELAKMERFLIRKFKPFLNDTTRLDRKKKKGIHTEKCGELEILPRKKKRGRKKGSPNKKPASGYIHPRKDSEHWVYQYWDIEQRKKRSLSVHPDDVEPVQQARAEGKSVDEIIGIIRGRRKNN
ncbi:MAG: hypothetical protein AAGA60_01755 [Cyanobacteria bacterium P01_E01_bin.42]